MVAFIADLFTPVLLVMTLILSFRKQHLRQDLLFLLTSFLIITLHYQLDAYWQIWGRYGHDYSSHTAVLVPLVILTIGFRKWLAVAMFLCLVYFWLMTKLGYHTLVDIVSTLIFVTPQLWLVFTGFNRWKPDQPPVEK